MWGWRGVWGVGVGVHTIDSQLLCGSSTTLDHCEGSSTALSHTCCTLCALAPWSTGYPQGNRGVCQRGPSCGYPLSVPYAQELQEAQAELEHLHASREQGKDLQEQQQGDAWGQLHRANDAAIQAAEEERQRAEAARQSEDRRRDVRFQEQMHADERASAFLQQRLDQRQHEREERLAREAQSLEDERQRHEDRKNACLQRAAHRREPRRLRASRDFGQTVNLNEEALQALQYDLHESPTNMRFEAVMSQRAEMAAKARARDMYGDRRASAESAMARAQADEFVQQLLPELDGIRHQMRLDREEGQQRVAQESLAMHNLLNRGRGSMQSNASLVQSPVSRYSLDPSLMEWTPGPSMPGSTGVIRGFFQGQGGFGFGGKCWGSGGRLPVGL